ncbi:unnamed protein product [Didymodactylos carnosus]|nr:unnamed protein product [Didymodactylos carnosus]CAF4052908.1 unnamed protein product [Didymodactylos carnosus]
MNTLQACRDAVETVHSVYDQLLLHSHDDQEKKTDKAVDVKIDLEKGAFLDKQRTQFHQLISAQRSLVVQDTSLIRINESDTDAANIEELQGRGFIANLHSEISNICQQLSGSLNLWSKYFLMTQTWTKRKITGNTHIQKDDDKTEYLRKHEECLIQLHQTVAQLHEQHQQGTNRLLDQFLEKLKEKDENESYQTLNTLLPYATNDDLDVIIVALSSLYYSTTHLIKSMIGLGTTIHTLYELETTNTYRPY